MDKIKEYEAVLRTISNFGGTICSAMELARKTLERFGDTENPFAIKEETPKEENVRLTFKEWRELWEGRVFRCKDTGEIFVIPKGIRETDFFSFGNCFVDVGRVNCYSRFGGNIEELHLL